jgi:hypothetical protein
MTTPAKLRQHVRYVNSADGTRIAWADSGTGPLIVKAANWSRAQAIVFARDRGFNAGAAAAPRRERI